MTVQFFILLVIDSFWIISIFRIKILEGLADYQSSNTSKNVGLAENSQKSSCLDFNLKKDSPTLKI